MCELLNTDYFYQQSAVLLKLPEAIKAFIPN
jgi:hypothetical protein